MTRNDQSGPAALRAFERKVLFAKFSLVVEQLWLIAWLVLAIGGVFLLVSYFGVWARLGFAAHVGVLAAFAVALVFALAMVLRIRWPKRDDAIFRIEQISGVRHRPASSYEDTLTGGADKAETTALWHAHRGRMLALLKRLRPGWPSPRTDRRDPFAFRVLAILVLGVLTAVLGHAAGERVFAAFDFSGRAQFSDARLDAWITPPTYTNRVPVMLANGVAGVSGGFSQLGHDAENPSQSDETDIPAVPEKSALVVRVSGLGQVPLTLEVDSLADEPADENVRSKERIAAKTDEADGDSQEARFELSEPVTVRVFAGSNQVASWTVDVTPDLPPTISLTRPPQLTPRGSLKVTYRADDDYGVAKGEMKLVRVAPEARDPKEDWAKPKRPKGPRPILTRPPKLPLKIPQLNAKEVSHHTYFSLESHQWAGLKVLMTLEVWDVAGKYGQSIPFEMTLPERKFKKPLARAVAEQRRKLLDDPRYWREVRKALDALTLEPDGFIDDLGVYLGLRSVFHRLAADRTRAGTRQSIEQLWHIALRIEDGNLSDAEQRLRSARERLEKALEDGASEEELKALMNELRQAMRDFMKQLAQQQQDQQQPNGQNSEQQSLAQEDLERMMQNLEDLANSGAREKAQEMLSEMQDLMERLQAGKMDQAQQQRNREMMKMLDQLGDMVGDQQKLMDDTFDERRGGKEQRGGRQRAQQPPPPGLRGMGGDGQEGQMGAPPGQSDRAQRGRRGQTGSGGQQAGGMTSSSLGQRQEALRERLRELQEQMRRRGGSGEAGEKLGRAEESMSAAEQALRDGDLAEATDQQGQALDQMREGAQSMAQQMMENSPQRYGRGGDSPRDPLGRPQRSRGPLQGRSVKVPEQIDIQRAREILEELRRRLGDATRPPVEFEYLERLLKRF